MCVCANDRNKYTLKSPHFAKIQPQCSLHRAAQALGSAMLASAATALPAMVSKPLAFS